MAQINGLRFIVGNGCNYNCFYCHHEGYFNRKTIVIDKEKLKKLQQYAKEHGIQNISITGGEPFMYWENTYEILQQFDDNEFNKTLNTNLSLLNQYMDQIDTLNPIEFHINLSSLNANTHKKIIDRNYLKLVLQNLELLRNTHHKICLNIPVLKEINYDELIELYCFAKERGFIPRFLVLMATSDELKSNVVTINEIIKKFGGGSVTEKYSYGLYKANTPYGVLDIVKCLCDDMECEICKKNTYLHITPDLNIKYCMYNDDTVKINFENDETIETSFNEANKRLELIKK